MNKYIYDEKTDSGMSWLEIIVFPALPYPPRKNSR